MSSVPTAFGKDSFPFRSPRWMGWAVRLELHTRPFFCQNQQCSRQIFTERLPGEPLEAFKETNVWPGKLRNPTQASTPSSIVGRTLPGGDLPESSKTRKIQ